MLSRARSSFDSSIVIQIDHNSVIAIYGNKSVMLDNTRNSDLFHALVYSYNILDFTRLFSDQVKLKVLNIANILRGLK